MSTTSRRRSKPSKDDITRYFEETLCDDPVTLQDIARAIGMSESKVRAEVLAGEIEGAFMVPYDKSPNPRGRWRIPFRDAQAYLYRIGAIRLPTDHPIATKVSAARRVLVSRRQAGPPRAANAPSATT